MEATKKEVLEFLKNAKQFELDAMQTYADQAEDTEGDVKSLLLKISEEERIHANMVQKIIEKVEARSEKGGQKK